jgi:hypothetical protein
MVGPKAVWSSANASVVLQFNSSVITGSGVDIIGPFTFNGKLGAQGHVAMLKQYVGQHSVEYQGTYDGEGLMWGEWQIHGTKDRWLIRFKSARSSAIQSSEFAEIS